MDKFDPPSDPFGNDLESKYCEYCNLEMEPNPIIQSSRFRHKEPPSYSCKNSFCPSKHEGVYKDMALYIIELEDEVEYLKNLVKKYKEK